MSRATKLTGYLILNLLLGSACLLAEERPQIQELHGQQKKGGEPKKEKKIAPENRMRVGLKGLFSEDFRTFVNESKRQTGMTPVMGFGALFDYPLLDFLSVGAQFDTRFGITKKNRDLMFFDINAFAKIPFSLSLAKPMANFYLLVPAGFSLGLNSAEQLKLKSIFKGANVGGFIGKEFFFAERYGILFEGGYVYRYLGAETEDGRKLAVHFHEMTLNVGFTFGF